MDLIFFGFSLVFYFAIHSILAHKTTKAFLMDNWIPQKFYRILFNLSSIGFLIPIFLFYKKTNPNVIFENELLEILGIIELLAGFILLLLSLRQYNLSEFAGTQQYKYKTPPTPEKLNTTGLNKWVRHPLYFSTLLLIWGYFLFRPTDLNLVISVITSLYLYFGTKLEEEKLIEEFGKDYQNYQKKVPMLIPFIK